MTSKHFTNEEISCNGKNCCGGSAPDNPVYMTKLEAVRESYGKPMYVTNMFRCLKHNKEVGGHPNSNHTKMRAGDFYTDDKDYDILAEMAKNYFNEVIIYWDRGFIHIGDD